MSDLYRSLDLLLSWLKGHEYRFDRSVRFGLLRRTIWLLRGALKCPHIATDHAIDVHRSAGEPSERDFNSFRKGVTLERGVVIDELSREGIAFEDNVVIGPGDSLKCSETGRS